MFRHPKAGAIGIASLPFGERDKDGVSLKAAYRLIEGTLRGYQKGIEESSFNPRGINLSVSLLACTGLISKPKININTKRKRILFI
jgi:hypothetical protein